MTTPGAPLELKSWLGPTTVISADAVEVTRNGQTQRYAKTFIKGFRAASGRGITYFTLELLNEPKPFRFNVPTGRAAEVRAAQRVIFSRLHLVAEPGGCVALAAILAGKLETDDATLVMLTGGNVDADQFAAIIASAD